jgi:pilus assembly protein CpaE
LLSVIDRTNNIVQQEKLRANLKQIQQKEAAAEVRRLAQRDGKIITVYSPKGGSGVSTIVANLGYLLKTGKREKQVLLVDLNLQYGDTSYLFNQIANRSIIDLAIRVQNLDDELVETVVLTDDPSGVDLLAPPQKLDLMNEIDTQVLSQILEHLKHMYDYIVINTNPHINEAYLSCFSLSDLILLVTLQQVITIRSIRSFLNLLSEFGISRDKVMLIINQYDETNSISSKKISEMLQVHVSHTLISDVKTVEKAANLGIPFTLDNRKAEISRSFQKLMEMVQVRIADQEKIQA